MPNTIFIQNKHVKKTCRVYSIPTSKKVIFFFYIDDFDIFLACPNDKEI